MAALDAKALAAENIPPLPSEPASVKRPISLWQTAGLLLLATLVILGLAFAPGFIRSNSLPLPILNNLENPLRSEGFYPTESNPTAVFRWSGSFAKIYLPETLTPRKISLEVSAAYPENSPRPRLHLRYAGQEIGNWELNEQWQHFEAPFPANLNLAAAPLELIVENPLAAHKSDNRVLGVAVRSADLEVSRLPSPGLLLTLLTLGLSLLLVGRWLGFNLIQLAIISFGPVLLMSLYWQIEPFYGSLLVGWVALAAGLLSFEFRVPSSKFHSQGNPTNQVPSSTHRATLRNEFQVSAVAQNLRLNSKIALNVKVLLPPLIILGLIFFEYGRVLDFGFHWDDYHIARPWGFGEVAKTFAGSWDALGLEPAYYRPLTVVSFALDWSLWGYEPRGYHMTSLLLFGVVVVLLYLVLLRLKLPWLAALVGSLFFVLLPANVAAATWISERSDTLAAIFVLAGVLAGHSLQYAVDSTQSKIGRWPLAAGFWTILAVGSKEIGVVLPLLLALNFWLFRSDKRGFGWKNLALKLGPSFVVLGLYLGWRTLVLPAVPPDPTKMVNPQNLWSGYYSAVYQSFEGLDSLITEKAAPWLTLTLLLVMALALLLRPQSLAWKALWFGLGWVLLSCAPLAFLGASYSVTSRVLFLPELGFAIMAAALVGLVLEVAKQWWGSWRFWPTLALLAFLLIAPYNPLHTSNQRAQKDYAPNSFNDLRWDEWIYNNPIWKAKIPERHYKTIEQKLKDAGRIR